MRIRSSNTLMTRVPRIPRRKILFSFAYFIYLTLFVIWAISAWNAFIGSYQERVFPWVITSFFINVIGLAWADRRNIFDVSIWFLVLSYAFMFGRVFTHVFSMQTTLLWDPISTYSIEAKFHASIFAIACLCMFTVGCLTIGNASPRVVNQNSGKNNKFFYIGIVCLLMGFICNAYSSFAVVSATQATGSYASYTDASTNGVISSFGFLFVPGVLFLLASKKLSYLGESLLFSGSVTYFLIVMVLSGSRKTAIFAILALVLAYLPNRKFRLSVARLVEFGLLGLLFLNLIYVIREMRFSLAEIIPAFLTSLQSLDFLGSIASESFAEAGSTFYSVAGIMQTVPTIFPYEFGMTFVRSACSILPIGWAVGDFFDLGSSTYVINRFLGAPVGASLIGDFYWNWGFFGGCIGSFIFGASLAYVRNRLTISSDNLPYYYSLCYIMLIGIRSGFFELARPLFLVLFVPYLVSLFYSHYRMRRRS